MWATCRGQNTARFPIWSCSRWGLPCRWCCHQRGALLPHHFTLTPAACPDAPRGALLPHHFTLTGAACAALRRYLSVALSVGSRPPGVTWHRALWSPDFPPCARAHSDCLAGSGAHHSTPSLGGCFLFELQRPLVCLVVAHRGDLRRQPRRLLERQLRQQRLEHAVERALVACNAAGIARRARDHQDD